MTAKEKEDGRIRNFVREHKVALCIVGGTVVAVLTFFGIRYAVKLKASQVEALVEAGAEIKPVSTPEPVLAELPFKYLWENLSGESLTPTKLGNEALTTAQKVNKLLVEHGLQERTINGEYVLTDLGRKFGKSTWKVTSAGHSFTNIEWDKRVLEIIFTPEELQHAAELRQTWADYRIA